MGVCSCLILAFHSLKACSFSICRSSLGLGRRGQDVVGFHITGGSSTLGKEPCRVVPLEARNLKEKCTLRVRISREEGFVFDVVKRVYVGLVAILSALTCSSRA